MYRDNRDYLYRIQKEHQRDLVREAEMSRPIHLVRGSNRSPLFAQLILWIGRHMMASGYSLLKRYRSVSGECPASALPMTQ
jgi:hypothetical protein